MEKKTDIAALDARDQLEILEKMMENEELSVEDAFAELENLIRQMEAEGVTLEDSFACYERGIRLIRYCNARIDRVEKKVRMLRGEGQAPMQDSEEI